MQSRICTWLCLSSTRMHILFIIVLVFNSHIRIRIHYRDALNNMTPQSVMTNARSVSGIIQASTNVHRSRHKRRWAQKPDSDANNQNPPATNKFWCLFLIQWKHTHEHTHTCTLPICSLWGGYGKNTAVLVHVNVSDGSDMAVCTYVRASHTSANLCIDMLSKLVFVTMSAIAFDAWVVRMDF